MTLPRLVIREIGYRKLNFALALLSVAMAVGCLVGVLTVLRGHDIRTAATMAKLEDDIRREMKQLGFNVRILPKGQNLEDLYARDYASKFMPEDYVHRLANSRIMTIRHLLPSLRQKIQWPEQNGRVVILVGVRGEVPLIHRTPKSPILHPVPPGSVVVGHLLHRGLGLKVGDTITVMGAKFKVHKLQPETGTKDDITLWVNLDEAQALLGTLLGIKPILGLKDGEVVPMDKVRGGRNVIPKLVSLFSERVDPERPVFVAVGHASAPRWGSRLKDAIGETFQVVELYEGEIGPIVGAHAGPGTVGCVLFAPDAEELELLKIDS